MGNDPPVGENSKVFSPPGGASDGRHGPQTSKLLEMSVYTHWDGTGNGGDGGYQGIYCLPPENGCTVHCDLSYHGRVSGGKEEDRTAPIQDMIVAASYGYPGDNGGACISGGEGETGTEEAESRGRRRIG